MKKMRETMHSHVDDATLDAWVDGELPVDRTAEVVRHLEACADCRTRAEGLREVMTTLAALPRSIHPEADLLPGVRARLVPRVPGGAPGGQDGAESPRERAGLLWSLRWQLAAAAVLVAAVSSALTVAVTRVGPVEDVGPVASPESSSGVSPALAAADPALARLSALEAEYVRAAEELARSFAARATDLDPETRALVERNLATIDRAIVEVGTALRAAPASENLRALLLASHERKLDFLRRASELTL